MIRLRPSAFPALRRARSATLRALLCAILPLLPAGCLPQGTESGTETGFQGALTAEDGTPAGGAEVFAFRTGSRTSPGTAASDSALVRILLHPDTLADTAAFVKAVADGAGEYRFTGLAPGWWSAVALHADSGRPGRSVGSLPAVKVAEEEMAKAGDLALGRVGGIAAIVTYAGAPLEDVTCHIPGLSFVALTDSAGRCLLLRVPEGNYVVAFTHPGLVKAEASVTVESGSLYTVPGGVGLVRSAAGAPPAPQGLRASLDEAARVVTLEWDAVDAPDLLGYRVSRAPADALPGAEVILHAGLLAAPAFRDTLYRTLPDTAGAAFVYRVRALDSLENPGEAAVLKPLRVLPSADPVRLAFADSAFSASEGAAAVARVRRSGPAGRPVSVRWELEALTATPGADYGIVSGELRFPAGAREADLAVPFLPDGLVEPVETLRVRLLDAAGGAVIGTPAAARLEIRDDDSLSRILCPAASHRVRESDSAAVLEFVRAGDMARRATVRWATRAGTAEAGRDFVAASDSLVFEGGAASLRVPVRLVRDSVEEKPERFAVVLSHPGRDVDATACPEVVVDIADDDTSYVPVPVDFTRAFTMHHGWRVDVSRFPGGLYEGDTTDRGMGIVSRLATNAALLPRPVAHWDFADCGQETLPDRASGMHYGRPDGGMECRADSAGAWALFGEDDSVVVSPHPDFDFGREITVSAWVRPDSAGEHHTLVAKQYGPTVFALEVLEGRFGWTVGLADGSDEGRSSTVFSGSAAVRLGEWTHVAGTFDGEVQRLFVNGIVVAERYERLPLKVAGNLPVIIGNHPDGNDYYGGIREIKIWNQSLTPHQVAEQMDLDKAPPRPFALTFDFATPIRVQGAGSVVSSFAGTARYHWKLAGAASVADLDGRTGTYVELGTAQNQAPDAWSRVGFPARELKVFRFTFEASQGRTGYIQVNEVSLVGAERVKL